MANTKNVAASVRQRLYNMAKKRGDDFQILLTRYTIERLLYRLGHSPHRAGFILKGATLFSLWGDEPYRATRDLDLLGIGKSDLSRLRDIFRELCRLQVENDGIRFDPDTVDAVPIREDADYGGVRVTLVAYLDRARVPVQVDVGFGDALVPLPEDVVFPTILDFPSPKLRAYRRETVVAEKFQAMVMLGLANSRMRDFYDVWQLSLRFGFEGSLLRDAINATFTRRRTQLPAEAPTALTASFYEDPAKSVQWRSFLRRGMVGNTKNELREVAEGLLEFLMPPCKAALNGQPYWQVWQPGGPWIDK
jgi:hypothetical protein